MYSVNTLNNNGKNLSFSKQAWLEYTSVENQQELCSQYANICQLHKQKNKWVLFINPEESSLEKLAKMHNIDVSKVLCVSFKGKNKAQNMRSEKSAHLDIEQIKSVLCRGNCSAVIMSNASFDNNEMNELNKSARIGKTHCVLLTNERKELIATKMQLLH
jgi:cell division inhibitor SulA